MRTVELKNIISFLEEENSQIEQVNVSLNDIEQLQEFNPRDGLDPESLKSLESVEDIPSIKLAYHEDYNKLIIIDGNHRYTSRFNRGEEMINATIKHYKTKKDMFMDATVANLFHGLTLSKKDRIESLSKIIENESLATNNNIKFKQLAERLGNIPPRELQKINAWNIVREKLNDERKEMLGLNVSKADRFYSLIIKMNPFDEKKFLELFDNLIDMSFNNIFEEIRKFLADGTINSKEEINKENLENETKQLLDLMEGEDLLKLLEESEEYQGEIQEIEDIIIIDDVIEEILNDIKFKSAYFDSNYKTEINNPDKVKDKIKEIRQYLNTLEKELGE